MFSRAKRAVEMAAEGADAGIDAIIFSAIAAEAFPNDLATWAAYEVNGDKRVSPQLAAAVEILTQAESDRVQIKLKYQLVYYALTGLALPKGKPPFQDFAFLVDLRNALVHHKPDVVLEHGKFSREVKMMHAGLIQRGLVKRSPEHMPYDWRALLDEEDKVARWAVGSCASMVSFIIDALPASKAKKAFLSSGVYQWNTEKN